LGGLIALLYFARQLRRFALTRSTLGIVATYWHFMALLWLYLLGLLWFKV
jgi:heme/copper-type cytochrome/quinol oxidase subunit 3